jgi:DNA-binding response OmpR family regulator
LGPQPWPWVGEPRVLIEHPDDATGLRLASALRREGFAVAVCPGPAESERCPLTGPEGCALAHGADVVVSALGLDRSTGREVLGALRARLAGTALVVEVVPELEDELRDLLAGCHVVESPVDPDELVASVREALASRQVEEA